MPEVKRTLGEYLIGEAPYEEDRDRNTDLIVLRMEAVRVGCRIRRPAYLDRYADEFTIRTARPNGCKTELAKIIEGWGNYMFYGISDAAEEHLACWVLLNLSGFRLWYMAHMATNEGRQPGTVKPNRDGSSEFRAFKIDDLPVTAITARWLYTPQRQVRSLEAIPF
jgi:hypothetical protein